MLQEKLKIICNLGVIAVHNSTSGSEPVRVILLSSRTRDKAEKGQLNRATDDNGRLSPPVDDMSFTNGYIAYKPTSLHEYWLGHGTGYSCGRLVFDSLYPSSVMYRRELSLRS